MARSGLRYEEAPRRVGGKQIEIVSNAPVVFQRGALAFCSVDAVLVGAMPHPLAFVLPLIFHAYCLGIGFVYGMFITETTLLYVGLAMMFLSIALDRRGVLHFNRDTT